MTKRCHQISQQEDQIYMKEKWTEHRITLIAFEAQFVIKNRPTVMEKMLDIQHKKQKSKKKNIDFESGFQFPGLKGGKLSEIDIKKLIMESSCKHLKDLIINITNDDMKELQQLILMMLELKHSLFIKQFILFYEEIIKQIKDIKFEAIKVEGKRVDIIQRIAKSLADNLKRRPEQFKNINQYLRQFDKETGKFIKVTIYCFLAELHNFNINEYYADAFNFDILEEERSKPKKKRKTSTN